MEGSLALESLSNGVRREQVGAGSGAFQDDGLTEAPALECGRPESLVLPITSCGCSSGSCPAATVEAHVVSRISIS